MEVEFEVMFKLNVCGLADKVGLFQGFESVLFGVLAFAVGLDLTVLVFACLGSLKEAVCYRRRTR